MQRLSWIALAVLLASGCVERKCYDTSQCEAPRVCGADGRCVYECAVGSDCAAGSVCEAHRCQPAPTVGLTCPGDMVAVRSSFCIDRYEASRRDATATSGGSDEAAARSVRGVLPWYPVEGGEARAACQAAGKRLCRTTEWATACQGPGGAAYGYGSAYEPATCNGIDAFCDCAGAACSGLQVCPAPHCYGACGADFHVTPTGSFPACHDEWGAFDLNGNVWELVDLGDGTARPRGGAYNCSDSEALHRCDYVASFDPPARGFRCCSDGITSVGADAGVGPAPDAASAPSPDAGVMPDAGCVDGPDAAASTDAAAPAPDAAVVVPADAGDPDATAPDATPPDAGPGGDGGCPTDMAESGGSCIDLYEASHDDATGVAQGSSSVAASRAGVVPWWPVTTVEARGACQAAGKRLCRSDEWASACGGPSGTTYSYGDAYQAATCNGIDAFCDCGATACQGLTPCPYPHCYDRAVAAGGGPCGAIFHPVATGAFPGCRAACGAFDLNGNVWEVVESSDGLDHARGGAFNCGDSEALHRCDLEVTWNPPARGFRCCRDRP